MEQGSEGGKADRLYRPKNSRERNFAGAKLTGRLRRTGVSRGGLCRNILQSRQVYLVWVILMENKNYFEDTETAETTVTYSNYGILVKNIKPIMGEKQLSDLVNKKISNLIKNEFAKNIKV